MYLGRRRTLSQPNISLSRPLQAFYKATKRMDQCSLLPRRRFRLVMFSSRGALTINLELHSPLSHLRSFVLDLWSNRSAQYMRITNIIITTQHLDIFPRWTLTKARWGTVRAFQRTITIRDVRIIHLNIKEYDYPKKFDIFLARA